MVECQGCERLLAHCLKICHISPPSSFVTLILTNAAQDLLSPLAGRMHYDAGKVGFTPTALLPVKKQFLCHLRAFALAAMRNNPRDWRVEQIESIAARAGLKVRKNGGSHVVIQRDGCPLEVCVPARKPIKAVYIVQLLALLDWNPE